MYLQLLANFKTKFTLTYCGMAIASWCLALGGDAIAQTPPIDAAADGFDDIASELLVNATSRDLVDKNRNHNPLGDRQVAQVTAPLPVNLPIIITPNLLPGLLPPSNPLLVPINSVLTPELIFAPNNTPAVPSSNAPLAPNPAATRDPRFIIAPQVLAPKVVDPFSTQFVLNGNKVSHVTTTVVTSGFESGNFRNTDLIFDV